MYKFYIFLVELQYSILYLYLDSLIIGLLMFYILTYKKFRSFCILIKKLLLSFVINYFIYDSCIFHQVPLNYFIETYPPTDPC